MLRTNNIIHVERLIISKTAASLTFNLCIHVLMNLLRVPPTLVSLSCVKLFPAAATN